uniref:UBN2 domain-containing protein n=1 Tax=Chenopodium quinoa TaxID=63459 RepID=A0A803MU64_CHEQI
MGIDYECWLVVKNGPNIITKTDDKGNKVLKKDSELDTADYKLLEKNAKAMSISQQAIGETETNRIFGCSSAKEIWDTLELAFEGTSEVKRSKIDLIMSKYELFAMNKNEKINDCFRRFMTIVNDLRSLGKSFSDEDLVRKFLRSLTDAWTAKVTAVYEAKDLSTLSLEQLIGSLMTHEMLIESKSEKELVRGVALKGTVEEEEDEISMIAKRFERSLRDQKKNFKDGRTNNLNLEIREHSRML